MSDQKPDEGAPTNDETGVIDLNSTQAIPEAQRPGIAPRVGADGPESPADAEGPRGWFDDFAGEHPAEGPGVPVRADTSWGSDRADAVASEAHRAAYVPRAAAPASAPVSSQEHSSAPASAGGSTGGGYYYASAAGAGYPPPTGSPVGGSDVSFVPAPAGSADGGSQAQAAKPKRRRRGLLVTMVVLLALLCGLAGGVAGQYLANRVDLAGSTLPEPGPGVTARPPGSVANIAASVLPSVVTIKVEGNAEGGTGSGFVIDNKGHVLTNNHVVEAAASGGQIEVLLSNGDSAKATIVGRDASYDLAVIKVARTDLTPLVLGESAKAVVGDQVIAVGAPLGLEQTVTTGIISALDRPVTPGNGNEQSFINAIQTDAAINPGNSGGPLLDMSGKVIGVNSAIARVPGTSGASGGNIGLGFAIPSDVARRTADQLIATGKAVRPVIGVQLDRTYSGEGAQVSSGTDAVTPNGPAAKAGVKPGDVVVGFEGKRVRTPDQLIVSIRARAVGETVTLKVQRGGQEIDLKMRLEADPAS